MVKVFKGDWRVYRVCMATSDPLDTYHKIKSGYYSIITFLDFLEMLDVRDTIREDQEEKMKAERERQKK